MLRLEALRKQKGLSQVTFAKQLNITQQAYANYENGKRQPDNDTLARIADILNISVDYLLGRTENPSISQQDYNEISFASANKVQRAMLKYRLYQLLVEHYGNEVEFFNQCNKMTENNDQIVQTVQKNNGQSEQTTQKKDFIGNPVLFWFLCAPDYSLENNGMLNKFLNILKIKESDILKGWEVKIELSSVEKLNIILNQNISQCTLPAIDIFKELKNTDTDYLNINLKDYVTFATGNSTNIKIAAEKKTPHNPLKDIDGTHT